MSAGSSTAGGRRRLSGEQRRAQLTSATVDCLADRGFRGTSAEEISRRAGVSKGLLWHYFDDLDDLMRETARGTLRQLAVAVSTSIDLTAPVPVLIRAAVHAAAGLRLTHAAERAALEQIVTNLRSPDGSQRLTLRDYEDLHAGQEQIFRRGQTEGDVDRGLDPRILAVTYQGAVDAMLGYLDLHPELDATAYADTVADILLTGMVSRGPTAR